MCVSRKRDPRAEGSVCEEWVGCGITDRGNCIGRSPEAEGACLIQEKEISVSYGLGGRGH